MRNMKKRKVNTKNKEELIRSNKNKKRIIIMMMLVIAYFVINMVWNEVSVLINPEVNGSITSNESSSDSDNEIVDYVKGFMYGILSLEHPWFVKLLVFLGIVYLFQVALSITGDIVQLILITMVAIIRVIRWIYRKVKK